MRKKVIFDMGTIGGEPAIEILTIVHHAVLFDEAESKFEILEIEPGLFMKIVPYDF